MILTRRPSADSISTINTRNTNHPPKSHRLPHHIQNQNHAQNRTSKEQQQQQQRVGRGEYTRQSSYQSTSYSHSHAQQHTKSRKKKKKKGGGPSRSLSSSSSHLNNNSSINSIHTNNKTTSNTAGTNNKNSPTLHVQTFLLTLAFFVIWSPQNLMAPNLTQMADYFHFSPQQRDAYLGANIAFATGVLSMPISAALGFFADVVENRIHLFCQFTQCQCPTMSIKCQSS